MSKLDQAFSKVYQQTSSVPSPQTLGPSEAIPLSEALGRVAAEANAIAVDESPDPVGVPLETLGVILAEPVSEREQTPSTVSLETRRFAPLPSTRTGILFW